ncbi:hypothetical protein T492DRAFT_850263 [Pavlovales sp. CCMP2436]|nr:hypothetical protein T492DRAFT_850263 [Pavlovales sp. CCMP2436]
MYKFKVGGLVVDNYETTLPAEKGLSSSAALCVLLARAFSEVFEKCGKCHVGGVYGLKLSVKGEMELAYLGETTTPSQCGRMDQCCAFDTWTNAAYSTTTPLSADTWTNAAYSCGRMDQCCAFDKLPNELL